MKHKYGILEIIIATCIVIVTILFSYLVIRIIPHTFRLLKIFEVVFSGIASGFISAMIVVMQIRKNHRSLQFENQLKLREMFATPERMRIHKIIKANEEEPWLYGSDKKLKNVKILSDSDYFENEFEFKVYRDDYLGVFEIMSQMLEDKELDENLCFQSYSYRITKISEYKPIKKILEDPSNQLWELLKELIRKNNIWKAKNKIVN